MLVSIFRRNYELLPGIMTPYGANLSKTKKQHKYRFLAPNNIKNYTIHRMSCADLRAGDRNDG